MENTFTLHPKLKADLLFLKKHKLCQAFLLPDSDNPWVVLVPEVPNISEIHELSKVQQALLMEEIHQVSLQLKENFTPDKLNIASLGNMVPQLHIHLICRYQGDKAWPEAIFGHDKGDDQKKIDEYLRILTQ